MATNCAAALALPPGEGEKTVPSAAATPRRPRMAISRATIAAASHGEARPTATSAMSTTVTSSLSAVVSRNEPSLFVTFQRRAR